MRKRSTGEFNLQDLPRILARIQEDRPYWKLLDIGAAVLSQGEQLVQKTRMRTLDAIPSSFLGSVSIRFGVCQRQRIYYRRWMTA